MQRATSQHNNWHTLQNCPQRDVYETVFAGKRLRGYATIKTFVLQNNGVETVDGMLVVPGKQPLTVHVLATVATLQQLKMHLPLTNGCVLTFAKFLCKIPGKCVLVADAGTSPNVVAHACKLWPLLQLSN